MEELLKIFAPFTNPIMAGCALYVCKVASDLSRSIAQLNTQIAVIVERVDSHEKRISRIEIGT